MIGLDLGDAALYEVCFEFLRLQVGSDDFVSEKFCQSVKVLPDGRGRFAAQSMTEPKFLSSLRAMSELGVCF